jgi:hypothetical protein
MSSLNPLRRHSPQVSLCITHNNLNTEIGNTVGNRIGYFQETSLQEYWQSTATKYLRFFASYNPPPTYTQAHARLNQRILEPPSRPHFFAIAFRICFMALYKTYYWSNSSYFIASLFVLL